MHDILNVYGNEIAKMPASFNISFNKNRWYRPFKWMPIFSEKKNVTVNKGNYKFTFQ